LYMNQLPRTETIFIIINVSCAVKD
jgi:hypothetical protein